MLPRITKTSDLVGTSQGLSGDGIDLRAEMEYILNKYGHFILLRRNFQIHCRCYTESIYKDGKSKCVYCAGTGFVNRVEKHLCRQELAVGDRTVVGSLNDAEFSRLFVDAHKMFLFHYVMPSVQDILYVVSWNNNEPQNLISEYEIMDAVPKRGDNGRIEFWAVYGRERPVGKKIRKVGIRRLKQNNIDYTYKDASIQYDVVW